MNRKRAILLIGGFQAMLLGIFIALFAADVLRPVTFVATISVVALVCAALVFVAIRKLPPM